MDYIYIVLCVGVAVLCFYVGHNHGRKSQLRQARVYQNIWERLAVAVGIVAKQYQNWSDWLMKLSNRKHQQKLAMTKLTASDKAGLVLPPTAPSPDSGGQPQAS